MDFSNANDQQFKAMTAIASSALMIAVGITSYSVTEGILLPHDATSPGSKSQLYVSRREIAYPLNFQPPSTHTSNLLVSILVLDWLVPFLVLWLYLGWRNLLSLRTSSSMHRHHHRHILLLLLFFLLLRSERCISRRPSQCRPARLPGIYNLHHICFISSPPLRHQVPNKLAL